MPVTADIMRTWRAPRQVIRDLLAMGPREDRAIAWLMAGCGLIFVAQWPRLARTAELTGTELDRLIAYELVAWLIVWPLVFYAVAWLSFLLLRLVRVKLTSFGARLALFWAFLAATPLGLLYGLQSGLNGPGPATDVVGVLWIGLFALFWVQGLRAVTARSS